MKWIKASEAPKKSGYYICWMNTDEQGLIHYHIDTGWQNGFYNDRVTHYVLVEKPSESDESNAEVEQLRTDIDIMANDAANFTEALEKIISEATNLATAKLIAQQALNKQ